MDNMNFQKPFLTNPFSLPDEVGFNLDEPDENPTSRKIKKKGINLKKKENPQGDCRNREIIQCSAVFGCSPPLRGGKRDAIRRCERGDRRVMRDPGTDESHTIIALLRRFVGYFSRL